MKTFIKNAVVVFPDGTRQSNILIDSQQISAIDVANQVDSDFQIDAEGLALIPGIIDDQVHFREPGLTHKEDLWHASRACAAGGVTSFLEMPNTVPNAVNQERLNEKLEIASKSSLVNYGFYIGATPENLASLKTAERTPGIKIFIGSSTGDLLVDDQAVLERIFAETSLPICAHCEDESTVRANAERLADRNDIQVHSEIRDHNAAVVATKRAIDLAERHRHPFHVLHVSTKDELELLRGAPEWVTSEVCPHHLFFSVEDYDRLGSLVKMNPSVKRKEDNKALWTALAGGVIDIIATDHAPHTLEEKQKDYPDCPSGLPAVENSLALMLNQVNKDLCSLENVVRWMCSGPAKIWNIKNKGRIEVGHDADLVLVDLSLKQTVSNEKQQTKCRWSPWHGTQLTGWPVRTWVLGREVYRLDESGQTFSKEHQGGEIQFHPPKEP